MDGSFNAILYYVFYSISISLYWPIVRAYKSVYGLKIPKYRPPFEENTD